MTGCWNAQFERVRRWHQRVATASESSDRADFLYAFFENAFHLRDWLCDTGAASAEELGRLIEENTEMRLCRDLANSHKHYSLRTPSQRNPPSEALEYSPASGNIGGDVSLVILSDGVKYDAVDLADRVMALWAAFIRDHIAR